MEQAAVRRGRKPRAEIEAATAPKRTTRTTRRKSNERLGVFDIPNHLIPKGYAVNWKRVATYGKSEDPSYQVDLQEQGWVPATVDQFPTLVPTGYKETAIIRRGMMLMIRPVEYSREAEAEDYATAREQVTDKLRQLGKAGKGEFKRNPDVTGVSREYATGISRRAVEPDDESEEE